MASKFKEKIKKEKEMVKKLQGEVTELKQKIGSEAGQDSGKENNQGLQKIIEDLKQENLKVQEELDSLKKE